ncbi:PaaI family thioesterase [Roseisalinus antarcticus]|uniref:Medium/long-chain acyl-CoA thioesterase YigI n=1 Tax=Roseisalinus antarcticus TaxID=254357 RepID=A0A1Y5T9Y0_9RHOB|nr:PaaI family thioesterase [Roseisalinus antarcticus]SLN57216.1 hypothetical protein ROA7023_02595 [Roseisalinus antarcticus]
MSDAANPMTAADVQAIVEKSAFLSWLGLEILDLKDGEITLRATWRPEWVANPKIGQTQGGILAALLDFAANFALVEHHGGPAPTVDLRVDYHRLAKKGDLIAKGRVIKAGRQISTSEATVHDLDDKLLASARGTFMAPRPPG